MPARQGKSFEINRADYKIDDFYKFYRTVYIKNKKSKGVLRKDFSKILYMYYSRCVEEVVLKNKTLRFSSNLGYLKIFKYLPSFYKTGDLNNIDLPIDFNATLLLWKNDKEAEKNKQIVRHLNDNSNGYTFFYKWVKHTAKLKNKGWYNFKATRTNKLLLSKEIKKGNVECFKLI